jgi:phosphatidylinositol alpha-1,6-mannosyltransferase
MHLTYVIDYVFQQTPDGTIWTDTSYDLEFWRPYVALYGRIKLLCRVQQVGEISGEWRQVTGSGVEVIGLPVYRGPWQYMVRSGEVKLKLRETFAGAEAVILRMPSNLARCAAKELNRIGRPFAVEVVGDPHEALAPGNVNMAGRAIFRKVFTNAQKSICKQAVGVTYVAQVLKHKYPARAAAPTLVCSDVRLEADWLRRNPRTYRPSLRRKLVTVASLSQTYKGIDVLLRALRVCIDRHFELTLTIVGTGKYRAQLERLAKSLGLTEHVHFVGAIPWGPKLIDQFDQADIFVLPSRVEVMPRALLEAMARGLPAIATDVGAVHELLDEAELVNPGDERQLAYRLIQLQLQARRLGSLSTRNFLRVQRYASHRLMPLWFSHQREVQLAFTSAAPKRWRKSIGPVAA